MSCLAQKRLNVGETATMKLQHCPGCIRLAWMTKNYLIGIGLVLFPWNKPFFVGKLRYSFAVRFLCFTVEWIDIYLLPSWMTLEEWKR